MRKILFYLFIAPILIGHLYGQGSRTILEDAIQIAEFLEEGDTSKGNFKIKDGNFTDDIAYIDTLFKSLSKYCKTCEDQTTIANIKADFRGNPFISDTTDASSHIILDQNKLNDNAFSGLSSLSSLTSLPATNFATGLADFLVKRTKEELNLAFFNRLKKFLNKDKNKPARILFPTTYKDIQVIDQQIYNWHKYVEGLQVSFYQDLNNLPEHLPALIAYLKKHQNPGTFGRTELTDAEKKLPQTEQNAIKKKLDQAKKEREESLEAVALLVSMGHGVINTDHHFMNLLHNTTVSIFGGPDTIIDVRKQSLGAIFKLVDLAVYESFWDPQKAALLPNEMIDKLDSDPKVRLAYLGLLYQQLKNVHIDGKSLAGKFKSNPNLVEIFKQLPDSAKKMVKTAEDLVKARKEWKELSKEKRSESDNFLSYAINQSNDIISLLGTSSSILNQLGIKTDLDQYASPLKEAVSMVQDIKNKNYSHLILTLTGLLEDVCYTQKVPKATNKSKMVEKDVCNFFQDFLFFGSFMAAIVEAENGEQVSNLIESYALPAGSASLKKNVAFSISVNSYVGGFAGWERIDSLDSNPFGYGISAPLGLAFSFSPYSQKWRNIQTIGSFSFYFSIIDVGALVAYRFPSDSNNLADTDPITIGEILAPSAQFYYGLPWNLPISIGGGYQLGPQLRSLTKNGNTISNAQATGRWQFMIAVDVPIVNLLSHPRKVMRH